MRLNNCVCRMAGLAVILMAVDAVRADDAWSSAPAAAGPVVVRVAAAAGEDPTATGRAAAESLLKALDGVAPAVVIVSECFEDRDNKQKVLAGIASRLPAGILVGAATYGSFTQAGCSDTESVCLVGIGGAGVSVSAALVEKMGAAKLAYDQNKDQVEQLLRAAGTKLAGALRRSQQDRLLILLADAHSPKNQALVEGVQQVVGKPCPIAGGCANKNAGQTFVYFRGQMYEDAAVALMLAGDFRATLSGRQAKENDTVISTAREAAAEVRQKNPGEALAALAFNCAGRRSKLKKHQDELDAIQAALGRQLPLFGCYCAGEIGPVDPAERPNDTASGGVGWHVMFALLTRP